MKSLEDREQTVKKLAEESVQAQKTSEELAVKQKETLDEARKLANKMIKDAENNAATLRATLTEEAKKEAEKIFKDGEKKLKEEQDKFYSGLRAELSSLVAAGIEKTVGKYVTKEINHKLVEEALDASVAQSKKSKNETHA